MAKEKAIKDISGKQKTPVDWPSNSVELSGFAGKDPLILKLDSGKTVARFSVGTHQMLKDGSDKWIRITTWHKILAWGNLAMQVAQYVRQGSYVSIHGRLRSRTIIDQNDQAQTEVFVVAQKITANIAA
jgi:single-strand DNA-binding protein